MNSKSIFQKLSFFKSNEVTIIVLSAKKYEALVPYIFAQTSFLDFPLFSREQAIL